MWNRFTFRKVLAVLLVCPALSILAQNSAVRSLPETATPGVPFTVTIEIAPDAANTFAYAVEEQPPAGWVVAGINEQGAFDQVNGKVKWGLYFDGNARTLTYQLTPMANAEGVFNFQGNVNFNGDTDVAIAGQSSVTIGSGGPRPPSIVASPADQAVLLGAVASFSVEATGETPLTYQWLHNGTEISGATSAIFSIASVELAHSGTYSVRVRNDVGSITSGDAILTLLGSVTVETVSGGTVVLEPDLPVYPVGTSVTLTAVADAGFRFAGWSGNASGTANPFDLVVNGTHTVTPVFEPEVAPSFTLSATATAGGSVVVSPQQATYEPGASVTLTALSESGFVFAGWSGDATGIEGSITIVMDADKTVTASFVERVEKFTLAVAAGAGGVVSIDPKVAEYDAGATVTLSAVAADGFLFTGWTGDAGGTDNPLVLTMDGNKSIQAEFAPAFTIATAVIGEGVVEFSPHKEAYFEGEVVEVRAIAAGGYRFVRWLGSSSSTDATISLTMTENKDLVAMFEAVTYSLTIEVAGSGSVTRSPNKNAYAFGDSVQLTAVPVAGSEFRGWGGDLGGAENPATVVIDGDKSITAIFVSATGPWTLTVQASGHGRIEASPNQPQYTNGKLVVLTPVPDEGFGFVEWTGDLSGSDHPAVLRMDKNKTVGAVFADVTPPVVEVALPAGGITAEEIFNLSGSVRDNLGLVEVRWERNGQAMGLLQVEAQTGSFTVSGLRLDQGINEFKIIAVDQAGLETVAVATVVWQPAQVLVVQSPPEQREGKRVDSPIFLKSDGEVGGMTFVLKYDPAYLADPQFTPASVIGSGFPTVNTDVTGEVRVTFALPGSAIPAGSQQLGSASFRARSVPFDLPVSLELEIVNVADANGSALSGTFDVVGGEVRILKRTLVGDNNFNNKYDVGDATILQRYAAGLLERRSWDLTLNDINQNNQIDAGDAIIVLRTVVGLRPQPVLQLARNVRRPAIGLFSLSKGVAPRAVGDEPPAEVAKLSLLSSNARPGEAVTVQVALQDIGTSVSGASFTLRYPVEALRLTSAGSYQKGPIVGADAAVVWNISPNQSDLATQDGTVSFAASSANAWANHNGVLAEFTFEVQAAAAAQSSWNLDLVQVEVTSDGYDQRSLPDSSESLSTGAPVEVGPPQFVASGSRMTAAGFVLSMRGGKGGRFAIDASSNLTDWAEIGQTDGSDAAIEVTDPMALGAQARFYRARQVGSGGTANSGTSGAKSQRGAALAER